MNTFVQLGFTLTDLFFLLSCIVIAVLGGMTDYILKRDNYISLPLIPENTLPVSRWGPLMVGRTIISICAGGLVWVVLSGGMPPSKENYLRLVLMAFVVGFAAPSLAIRYRTKIENSIDETMQNGS